MAKRLDLMGQKFGRWTVIDLVGYPKRGDSLWKAKCECGIEKTVRGSSLRTGQSKSCGCYQKEQARKRFLGQKPNKGSFVQGQKSWNKGKKFPSRRSTWCKKHDIDKYKSPSGAFVCRECSKETNHKRWKNRTQEEQIVDKKQKRQWELKKQYGIDLEQYLSMVLSQDNKCTICGKVPNKESLSRSEWSLCVDHDHNTGKIRGLLCAKCNLAIGLLEYNPNILSNAIDYIKKYENEVI